LLTHFLLIVVDVSKIRILRVVRNVVRHFVSFLSVERKYNYFTIKQGIKWLLRLGPSPVASNNPELIGALNLRSVEAFLRFVERYLGGPSGLMKIFKLR